VSGREDEDRTTAILEGVGVWALAIGTVLLFWGAVGWLVSRL
jgi:hypothetical protein